LIIVLKVGSIELLIHDCDLVRHQTRT